mmetsp:Transcript_66916/g.169781  ORF Transcript_66916/g.169781 Transcript_66916/m.169781 type:complete len:453 (+) Transcript_66916:59-1417(+)
MGERSWKVVVEMMMTRRTRSGLPCCGRRRRRTSRGMRRSKRMRRRTTIMIRWRRRGRRRSSRSNRRRRLAAPNRGRRQWRLALGSNGLGGIDNGLHRGCAGGRAARGGGAEHRGGDLGRQRRPRVRLREGPARPGQPQRVAARHARVEGASGVEQAGDARPRVQAGHQDARVGVPELYRPVGSPTHEATRNHLQARHSTPVRLDQAMIELLRAERYIFFAVDRRDPCARVRGRVHGEVGAVGGPQRDRAVGVRHHVEALLIADAFAASPHGAAGGRREEEAIACQEGHGTAFVIHLDELLTLRHLADAHTALLCCDQKARRLSEGDGAQLKRNSQDTCLQVPSLDGSIARAAEQPLLCGQQASDPLHVALQGVFGVSAMLVPPGDAAIGGAAEDRSAPLDVQQARDRTGVCLRRHDGLEAFQIPAYQRAAVRPAEHSTADIQQASDRARVLH